MLRGKYWNKELETMPLQELRNIEEELLIQQVRYVYYCSKFYRDKFDKAGLKLSDIKGLEDLTKIPFTAKTEIRDSQTAEPPYGYHLATSLNKVVRVHTTSGTTGNPVILPHTKHDLDVANECAARCFWTAGMRPGDVVFNLHAMCQFTGGLGPCEAIEAMGACIVPIGAESGTERILRLMKQIRPTMLLGTPSFVEHLANAVPRILGPEIKARDLGVKGMIVSGEPGGSIPSVRKTLEDYWGAQVFDWGGIGDVNVFMWLDCADKHEGMHFMAQGAVLVELINPETLEPIELKPNGEYEGELIYTHIDKEAAPLLRFRTRDNVIVNTYPCECGRSSYRIAYKGRTDDMLIVKGVNVFPSAIKDIINYFLPETTGVFKIVLSKDDPAPKVTPPLKLRVEYGKTVKEENLADLKMRLEKEIRSKLVFRAEVTLVPADTIEKGVWKTQLIEKEKV